MKQNAWAAKALLTDLIEAEDIEPAAEQDVLGAEAVDAGALQTALREGVQSRQVHGQHRRNDERDHVQTEQHHRRHWRLPINTEIKQLPNEETERQEKCIYK